MYHTINEFLQDWKFEAEATLKVFNNLTNEALDSRVSPISRTIGRLAWHIIAIVSEAVVRAGIKLETISDDNDYPRAVNEISEKYKQVSNVLIEELPKIWNEDSLKEKIDVFGEQWTKEAVLSSLIKHQIHHRAQMTALMRQAGLKVPGIYGPAYEEWKDMGMDPMV
jgi:uncharacterized damage-inducible protein DinB